jgi:hypothetical protein
MPGACRTCTVMCTSGALIIGTETILAPQMMGVPGLIQMQLRIGCCVADLGTPTLITVVPLIAATSGLVTSTFMLVFVWSVFPSTLLLTLNP